MAKEKDEIKKDELENDGTGAGPQDGGDTNTGGASASGENDGGTTTPPKETPPKTTTPPKTRATTTPPKEKKTVEVDADVLERLLNTVEKQGEQLKDLTAAADIGRLNRIQQARNEGKLVKNAKLSIYDGKVVIGWAKVKDDVFFDESGRLHEDQQVEVYLDQGEGKNPQKVGPISYRAFARLITKVEGEVISERKDRDGTMFYTVQLPDGREFELSIVFMN